MAEVAASSTGHSRPWSTLDSAPTTASSDGWIQWLCGPEEAGQSAWGWGWGAANTRCMLVRELQQDRVPTPPLSQTGASLLRSPTASAVFQEEADTIAELAHRGWYHPGGSTGRACCFQGPEGPAPEPGPGRAPVTRPVLLFLPGTRPCPSHPPPLPPHPLAQTTPHAQTQPLSSSPDASLAHPWGRMGCQDPRQLPTPHPPHTHLKLHQCQVPRTWYRFDFQNHVSWLCGLGQVPLRL